MGFINVLVTLFLGLFLLFFRFGGGKFELFSSG